jgi:hypothetical protein
MGLVATVIDTFGPFLIPATLFVVGVAGYAALWVLTDQRDKWAADDTAVDRRFEE